MAKKTKKEPKSIKLHIPGESFWAHQLSKNTAEVANILFSTGEYGLGDVVKFNSRTGEVVKLVKKKSNSVIIKYSEAGDVKENFGKLYQHFETNNVKVEGFVPGMAALSIPLKMSEKTFLKLVENCPVEIEVKS